VNRDESVTDAPSHGGTQLHHSDLRAGSRRAASNLALLLASLVVTLGLGELLTRITAPQQLILKRPDVWQAVDTLGWAHRPNVHTTINTGERTVQFITDADGLRVGARGPINADTRILLLGDSFIEALQVEYENTVAGLLEARLPHLIGHPVAVRNAGVGDWGPPQYYLRARQYYPHIGRFTSRDPVFGQFEEPLTLHAYIYCINDPVNKMDIWGLDSVALYDPKGRIGPDRVESADDYDHAIPVSNIRHALIELLILTFIEEVRIDDLYVFGHGMPGLQTVGGSPLLPYTQEWVAIAGTVEKTGAIHLRGCSVAAGSSGLTYLLNLANMGQRRITAFDEFVQHFGEERWGADYWSPGKLYMAVPNRGYKVISEGGWWREFYRRGRR